MLLPLPLRLVLQPDAWRQLALSALEVLDVDTAIASYRQVGARLVWGMRNGALTHIGWAVRVWMPKSPTSPKCL